MAGVAFAALDDLGAFVNRLAIDLRFSGPPPAQIGELIAIAGRQVPRPGLRALNHKRMRGLVLNGGIALMANCDLFNSTSNALFSEAISFAFLFLETALPNDNRSFTIFECCLSITSAYFFASVNFCDCTGDEIKKAPINIINERDLIMA